MRPRGVSMGLSYHRPTMREPTPQRLRVLFVCANDFAQASAKQALWFAQQLQRDGHAVMMTVTGSASSLAAESSDREGIPVSANRFLGPRVSPADVAAVRAFQPDVIHCWSSRLPAVTAARAYARSSHAPVVVHWEDDEWRIRDDAMGRSAIRRLLRPARRAASNVYPPLGAAMTAGSLRWVVEHAAALDALTPELAEHVSSRTGRSCEVILPATPDDDPGAPASGSPATQLLDELGGIDVALWTGSVHPACEADVRLALAAVAEVQSRGRELAFAHIGHVLPRYDTAAWAREAGLRDGTARFFGYVPYPQVPALLRRASVLLSCGLPNDYNRLRLPSKLQAYLASGTPTVTFAVGFGRLLVDRQEALLTQTGDPGELADRILEALDDSTLRATLRAGGPAAAARLFDPVANTRTLMRYYRAALGAPAQTLSDALPVAAPLPDAAGLQ